MDAFLRAAKGVKAQEPVQTKTADPFLSALEEQRNQQELPQRQVFKNVSEVNPDEVGESSRLAKKLNTPPEQVFESLDVARKADAMPDFEAMTKKNPVLADRYNDTSFAVVAQGDEVQLGGVEDSLREHKTNIPDRQYQSSLANATLRQEEYLKRTDTTAGLPGTNRFIDNVLRGAFSAKGGYHLTEAKDVSTGLKYLDSYFSKLEAGEVSGAQTQVKDSTPQEVEKSFASRGGMPSTKEITEQRTARTFMRQMGIDERELGSMTPDELADTKKKVYSGIGLKIWNELEKYQKATDQANSYERSPASIYASQAEGFIDTVSAIFEIDPIDVTSSMFAESLPASSAVILAGLATGGLGLGLMTSAAVAGGVSYKTDQMLGLAEVLQKYGIDTMDKKSLMSAFSNEELMAEVQSDVDNHALMVGIMDGFAMRIAGVGRVLPKKLTPTNVYGRTMAEMPARMNIDALAGAAGEGMGQIARGDEELAWYDIMAEYFGELGTAPATVATAQYAKGKSIYQEREMRGQKKRNEKLINKLETLSKESKTNERNPEQFKSFVEQAAKENGVDTVYLQTSAALQIMEENRGMSPTEIATWFEQYNASIDDLLTAIDTGGYISLDVGSVVSNFSTDELLVEMKPHMTPDQATATPAETGEVIESTSDVQTRVDEIEASLIEPDTIKDEDLPNIEKQLKQAYGMSDFEARVNSRLMARTAKARAKQLGITPQEFMTDRWRISFSTEEGTTESNIFDQYDSISQEDTPVVQETEDLTPEGETAPQEGDLTTQGEVATVETQPIEVKYEPERVPPTTEREDDGKGFTAAASVTREVHSAIQANEPELSIPATSIYQDLTGDQKLLFDQIRNQETAALRVWAQENDLLSVTPAAFLSAWESSGSLGGYEHKVALSGDGKTVRKVGSPALNTTWHQYFIRMQLHNSMFPDAAYKFLGFMEIDGELHSYLEQDAQNMQGEATQAEIDAELTRMGFREQIRPNHKDKITELIDLGQMWVNDDGVILWDVLPKNVIKDPDGDLVFIDPMIELDAATKADRIAAHKKTKKSVDFGIIDEDKVKEDQIEFSFDADPDVVAPDTVAPDTEEVSSVSVFVLKGQEPIKTEIAASFNRTITNVQTGSFATGIDQVNNSADAAHVVAQLRKKAKENMVVLALDENNKPIAIVDISTGTYGQSLADPSIVLGQSMNMPGVKSLWLAHNHPGGDPSPSPEDTGLTQRIIDAAKGSGVEVAGHVTIGKNGEYTALFSGEGIQQPTKAARTGSVPITDTRITMNRAAGEPLLRSDDVFRLFDSAQFKDRGDGVVLINSKARPVGWIPLDEEAMLKLRQDDIDKGSGLLLRASAAVGASRMVVRANDLDAGLNVARFGNATSMRPLEIIYDGDKKSATNAGLMPIDEETFYQTPQQDLYVSHNLSADNLIHADKMGALAVPSAAIARTSTGGFENFGEITLLAHPDLIDPKTGDSQGRDISFSEFKIALVPKNTPKKAIDILKKNGIKIKRYDRAGTAARHEALIEVVKSDPSVFFQNGLGLYSPLRAEMEATLFDQKTLTGAQVIKKLEKGKKQKAQTVKQDEIDAIGLMDYLELNKDVQLTKQEVLDFIDQNGVQIEEVVKSEPVPIIVPKLILEDTGHDYIARDEDGNLLAQVSKEYVDTEAEARLTLQRQVRDQIENEQQDPTRYSSYTLDGGEQYREVLLTLPVETKTKDQIAQSIFGLNYNELFPGQKADVDAKGEVEIEGRGFVSSHFEEPNILAHARINIRMVDGKKVFFVEEVQSDYNAKGRELGFKTTDTEGLGVPSAPFVTSSAWQNLILKRLLRMAAEEGADSVAWITGEQTAERYSLDKKLEYVNYEPIYEDGKPTGDFELDVVAIGGSEITEVSGERSLAEIENILGKDIARKIENGEGAEVDGAPAREWKTLTGDDLKMEAQWARNLYDKAVPNIMNKLGKKYGVKVEPTTLDSVAGEEIEIIETIDTDGVHTVEYQGEEKSFETEAEADAYVASLKKGTQQLSLPITPEMRQDLLTKGLPMFQEGITPQGAIRFGRQGAMRTADIARFEGANFSTFAHEAGHLFLEDLKQGAIEDGVTVEDWDAVKRWLGIGDDNVVTEAQHEKFARGFEAYLREGKSPSMALEKVFETFKKWMQAIYKDLSSLDVELTDEVRGVFDRMLATEAEIKEAQQTAAMIGMFDEAFMRDAGATTEDIAKYKEATGRIASEGEKIVNKKKLKELEKRLAKYRKIANAQSYDVPAYRFLYWISRGVFPDIKRTMQAIESTGGELANSLLTEAQTLLDSTSEPLVVDGHVLKATVSNAPEWFLEMNRTGEYVNKKTAANALKQYAQGKPFRSKEGQRVVDEYLRSLGNQLSPLATNLKLSELEVGDVYTQVVDGTVVESSIVGENKDEGTYSIETNGEVEQVQIGFNVLEDVVHIIRGANKTLVLAEMIGGGKTGAGYGLNPTLFKKTYGDVMFNAMPKIPGLWKSDGLSVEQAATDAGYENGKALVDDLTKAEPRALYVDKQVAKMDAEFTSEIKTEEAIRTEAQRRMLAVESAWLEKKLGSQKRKLSRRALRRWAEQRTDKSKMKEAVDIYRLTQESRRTRQKAISAQKRGKYDLAFDLNERVRMIEELILVHARTREDVKKMQAKWKQAVDADMKNEYRQQVFMLLEKYGMTTRNLDMQGAFVEGEPVTPLSQFMQDVFANITEFESTPAFSEWVINGENEGKWNKLTWEQVQELNDVVSFLVGRGREAKHAMLSDGKTRVADAAKTLVEGSSKRRKKKKYRAKSPMRGLTNFSRKYFADAEMLNFMFKRMDGFVNVGKEGRTGVNETTLWRRLTAAVDAKNEMIEALSEKLDGHLKQLIDSHIPDSELTHLPLPEVMAGDMRQWSWENVISVALNMGNLQNIDRLIEGFDLSEEQLLEITSVLSKKDWLAVQGVWNSIEGLYADIDRVHYNLNDFHIKRVHGETINVKTKSGEVITLEGGYYPLKFDPTLADKPAEWQEKEDLLMSQESMFGTPAAKSNFTKHRAAGGGALPVRLSLSVLSEHIRDTVQYITHAEVVRDIDRITRHATWKEAAMGSTKSRDSGILGEAAYRNIRPALAHSIRPTHDYTSFMDKVARTQRHLATAFILALNPSVALKQPFSVFGAISDIGGLNLAKGVAQVITHPLDSYKVMHEVSAFMRNRSNNIDSSIPGMARKFKFESRLKVTLAQAKDLGFILIKGMDFAAVYPIWWGAYKQEIARTGDFDAAVVYANETIRDSQPSSTAIDVSAYQRQRGFMAFFNMFATFVLKYGNRQRYQYGAFREGTLKPHKYLFTVWREAVIPPILMTTLFSFIETGEPPEPEELLWDVLMYQFIGMPFARDMIAGSELGYFGTTKISSPMLTGADLVKSTLQALSQAIERGDERAVKKLGWEFAKILSYSAGVPVSKVYEKIMKGVEDMERGKGTPINLLIPMRRH